MNVHSGTDVDVALDHGEGRDDGAGTGSFRRSGERPSRFKSFRQRRLAPERRMCAGLFEANDAAFDVDFGWKRRTRSSRLDPASASVDRSAPTARLFRQTFLGI